MTTQPDIDAIAKEARDQIWNSQDGVTRAEEIIVAAIRGAIQEVIMSAEIKEQARLINERDAAIEVLKAVEWSGNIDSITPLCPYCTAKKGYAHAVDCKLAKAIGK